MSAPQPWLTGLENAPPGASELLSAYSAGAPMPADVHARLLLKAAELSALKPLGMAAILSSKPAVTTIAIAIFGAGAVATVGLPDSPPAVRAPLAATFAPVAQAARSTKLPETPLQPEPIVAVEELAPEPLIERKPRPNAVKKPAPALVEEALLVDRALRVLDTDPAETLRICQDHELRFPNGQLGSARRALSMRALNKLGRTAEARQNARVLLERDPETLHSEEAARLAGEGEKEE